MSWWDKVRGKNGDIATGYTRVEDASVRAFYEPHVPFASSTSPDLSELVADLARRTGIPRDTRTFPVEAQALVTAAQALQAISAARGDATPLSLESAAREQIDVFMDRHVIDVHLRPLFAGGRLRRDLKQDEEERAHEGGTGLPNEPLLYFCLGAWWGEWLVRHFKARWMLEAPLNPLQTFPDAITSLATICLMPFSQVVKKVIDPEGDNLAFKGNLIERPRKEVPPYPLLASLADAEHATASLLKPRGAEAIRLMKSGDGRAAFDAFVDAIEEDGSNAILLALGSTHATRGGVLDAAEAWMRQLLVLHPGNRTTQHNLAMVLAEQGRLDEAMPMLKRVVAEDPHYGRARLTLASMLRDGAQTAAAMEHVEWVIANDHQLAEEAQTMKKAWLDA